MIDKQPDALQIAQELEAGAFAPNVLQNERALREIAASALRMLHAELSAIGAGGVEPLRKCLHQIEEPASLAASAGSEPVAYAIFAENGQIRLWSVEAQHVKRIAAEQGLKLVKLYTHPSPPEGMVGGWIALPGTLPEPGTPVLLDIGKKYPIRAMWAAKHTVESADDDLDWGEYDEATDACYAPEGWYEWNQHEDNHWRVAETPIAWMPLPPTTSAGSGKGE